MMIKWNLSLSLVKLVVRRTMVLLFILSSSMAWAGDKNGGAVYQNASVAETKQELAESESISARSSIEAAKQNNLPVKLLISENQLAKFNVTLDEVVKSLNSIPSAIKDSGPGLFLQFITVFGGALVGAFVTLWAATMVSKTTLKESEKQSEMTLEESRQNWLRLETMLINSWGQTEKRSRDSWGQIEKRSRDSWGQLWATLGVTTQLEQIKIENDRNNRLKKDGKLQESLKKALLAYINTVSNYANYLCSQISSLPKESDGLIKPLTSINLPKAPTGFTDNSHLYAQTLSDLFFEAHMVYSHYDIGILYFNTEKDKLIIKLGSLEEFRKEGANKNEKMEANKIDKTVKEQLVSIKKEFHLYFKSIENECAEVVKKVTLFDSNIL